MGVTADDYARMLVALLPPGRLWRTIGSKLYGLFLGSADGLVRVHNRIADLLREANPATAVEMLPEYEQDLALTPAATTAERQANVVALLVRRQGFKPADFQQALAQLLALAPADVVVIERSLAFVAAVGDQRAIFDFFVYRNPSLPGTYFVASAQQLVSVMKPSHTRGFVVESVNILCDDAHSLCDRDLLGA